MASNTELRRYLDRRLVTLRTERLSWWTHWRDLAEYIFPRRGRFLATPNQANRGSIKGNRIINNTATKAARALGAGMQSGVTSPTRPWFKMTLADADMSDKSPVKLWLDECHRRILTVLGNSNLYNALHTAYEEEGAFGTAVIVEEEDEEDIVCFTQLTIGEYMLANNKKGIADTLYREFTMTVGQVIARFGIDAVSPQVKSLFENDGQDREIIVAAAIEPVTSLVAKAFPLLRRKKFMSAYWELGQQSDLLLEVKGYDELPFFAFRWNTVSNEPYGSGPGMDCLGDIKSLQRLELKSAQGIDKAVDPPMQADVNMRQEAASLLPGSITYVPSQSSIGYKPAIPAPNIQPAELKIAACEKRINTTFFYDLFMMLAQMEGVQPRNQMEIQERKQEKMLQLGPVLERLQYELLDPLVERTFNIMARRGLLPPPPDEIAGAKLDVEYVGTLTEAQKAVDTTGVERLTAFTGNLAAVFPEARDNLDVDAIIRHYADMLGVPASSLTPEEKMEALRQARAKAMQQQQQAAMTSAAVQGAQTLSQTDVGGGQNALERMLGGAG